jgi:formiminoglutamase
MLEDPRFKKHSGSFVEFAAQGAQCSLEHVEYVQRNNGQIMWAAEMEDPVLMFETLLETCASDHIFVSFDLDCVRTCDAPGVSAPSPLGITARDAVRICYLAGKCGKVKLFDLSEFNPVIEEYMTGKLVGMMFHSFACGLAERH